MTNTVDFEAHQSAIGKSLTCPICNKICREVTGNEECCHIFCKNCITQKITEENLRACPVCNVDLGASPLKKLRNSYTEKRQYVEDEEGLKLAKMDKQPAPLSSSSSPIVMTTQNGTSAAEMNGTIRRSSRKRILLHPTLSIMSDESEENNDDKSQSPYKPYRSVNARNKVASRTKQNGSSSKSSRQLQSSKKGKEPLEEGIPINGHEVVVALKSPAATNGYQYKVAAVAAARDVEEEKEKESNPNLVILNEEERRAVIEDLNLPSAQMEILETTQAQLESSSKLMWTRQIPIWFNLVPSDIQNCTTAVLPPLSSNYLNVNLPTTHTVSASIIKKYLVQKFGLQYEDEVEISLSGRPIPSEMPVKDMLNFWVQKRPQSEKTIKVGSSAKDFVMVIYYSRRLHA